MRFKHLLIFLFSWFAISLYAQTESITPKYGVIDIDSIITLIPETNAIYQKVDSVQNEANKAIEPIALQLQEKETLYRKLTMSQDTLALNNLNTDAQLLYQELNLIQQKTQRTLLGYQKEMLTIFDNVKLKIAKVGERMQLSFIIAKEEHPVYTRMGLPIIFQSPYYYSGESVNVTNEVIKEIFSNTTQTSSSTNSRNKPQNTK